MYVGSTTLTICSSAFTSMAVPSTIYVRNNDVEAALSGKYTSGEGNTTIVNNNTWTAPTN